MTFELIRRLLRLSMVVGVLLWLATWWDQTNHDGLWSRLIWIGYAVYLAGIIVILLAGPSPRAMLADVEDVASTSYGGHR